MATPLHISPATATRILGLLNMFETPARAAHEVRVQLTAIRPYSDRASERVLSVLDKMAGWPDLAKATAQLRSIAATATTEAK